MPSPLGEGIALFQVIFTDLAMGKTTVSRKSEGLIPSRSS
jgi:hypothetical protein